MAVNVPGHMTVLEFLQKETLEEQSLPSLPSPTLTNPDMVLPNESCDIPAMNALPRSMRRPPSPSYLRDQSSEAVSARPALAKKEKRGLMSRKLMLLRSRTGSGVHVNGHHQQTPRSMPSDSDMASRPSEDHTSAYASSPTLQDVGNLAPEQPDHNRLSTSGSSFNSDELAGIPSFLAKYEHLDGHGSGDELSDTDGSAQRKKYGYSVSIEGGFSEKKRQQEEDEHNSALLSKRAEQILANAKKRLNLMEGNLRGARDLVAPLTAANLNRATSLGSSNHSFHAGKGRFVPNGYHHQPDVQPSVQTLHAQASSPTVGRDYQLQARGSDDTELPERPHTALEHSPPGFARSGRVPVRTSHASWTPTLRGSRSHDSFGTHGMHVTARERTLHSKGSPDSNLEPLPEDDASHHADSAHGSRIEAESIHGLGVEHSPSMTDGLREQMYSLKGKISTLKERAHEDRLRRQSQQNMRTSSPFNNALVAAPEFFYTQSQSYGTPVLDTNAGIGHSIKCESPATPPVFPKTWEPNQTLTGSRNAFAEAQQRQHQDPGELIERTASSNSYRKLMSETGAHGHFSHKRTPSGTSVVQPAADRYLHNQYSQKQKMPGSYVQDDANDEPSMGEERLGNGGSLLPDPHSPTPDYDDVVLENRDASVYEDAQVEQPTVVAHEDRDDAFNYEHFFLHSAMGSYSNGGRGSTSSEDSESSVATARGPTVAVEGDDEFVDLDSDTFPPPTPETPERLRHIERKLHKRTLSSESASTLDTFATADEVAASPTRDSRIARDLEWPSLSSENTNAGPYSHPSSRPSIASKRPEAPRRRNSSSERADSGIGFPKRSSSGHDNKRPSVLTPQTLQPHSAVASPPMSPRTGVSHDPAALAVSALINPGGRQLGLKDRALLFGLVETIRMVCQKLQDEDEGQYESRLLRRRLDDAKRILDGTTEQRSGSNGQ